MAHLGDFGAALKELDPNAEKDTFSFFGEKFEIIAQIPPMLAFQLAAVMTGKVDEQEGASAMWEAYTVALGKDEFNRLYRIAVAKKADEQSLMELVMSIFEASGGERPTVQVPDSPAGELPTSPSSSTSSSTHLVSGEEERDMSVPHLVPVSQLVG